MKKERIENFLSALRDSYEEMFLIFTEGSCFKLFLMLKAIFPEAEAYWSEKDGHCVTRIDSNFYDIGGVCNSNYIEDPEEGCYFRISEEHYKAYSLLKRTSEGARGVKIKKYEK